MTNMKELNKMSESELTKLVIEKREALRSHRFNIADRNTKAAREDKKDIARALTLLNERSKEVANDAK